MSLQPGSALRSRRSFLTLVTAGTAGLEVGMLTACGADGETMKGMLTNYAKENPNVPIDFQTLGWPAVFAKLDTTLVAGTPPARTSAQNSPLLQQDWAWEVRAFGQATPKYGRYEISPPGYTQIQPLWSKAIGEVFRQQEAREDDPRRLRQPDQGGHGAAAVAAGPCWRVEEAEQTEIGKRRMQPPESVRHSVIQAK